MKTWFFDSLSARFKPVVVFLLRNTFIVTPRVALMRVSNMNKLKLHTALMV